MPYTIKTKDGIVIRDIPDEVDPNSNQAREMVMKARADRAAQPISAEQRAANLNPGVQAANLLNPAPPVPEQPHTTAAGVVGQLNRALLPAAPFVAAGSLVGGAGGGLGGMGVGALPGSLVGGLAGLGAYGSARWVSDPAVSLVNSMFGTNYTLPTEAIEHLLTKLGVPEPKTEAERIVYTAAQTAVGAGSQVALARSAAATATPAVRGVLESLSSQPAAQIASGAGAGAASQGAKEAGAGPVGQFAAGLGGGMVAANLAMPRKITSPTPKPQALADAENAGIKVMTSDVQPPRTFAGKMAQSAGEKIPFVGTGAVRRTQQAQRIEAVRDLLRDFGAGDTASTSDAVMHDLVTKRSADLTKYTSLKNGVIQSLGDAGTVPVTRTVQAIDAQIKNLESLKLPELAPVISKLEGWKSALDGQTLDRLDLVRKQIGESFKDPSLAAAKSTGEKALNAIYAPLREDMGDFIKAHGQRNDFIKWATANKRLSDMSGELKTGALKSVLKSGDVTPEDIRKILFSSKPSDVKTLMSNLSVDGKANAKVAIISKVAEEAGGIENLNTAKFLTSIRKAGGPLGVIFGGEEAERLKGLVRALELTAHAEKAALVPPTGVQAVPILAADVLSKTLGGPMGATAGAATIGGLARVYESAPVRNILLKLPKTTMGSPEEAALFKRFVSVVQAQSAFDWRNP
jgi:hypothetical protein